jgi:hypothetical protein
MLVCCRHLLPFGGFPVPRHPISTKLCLPIAVHWRSPSSECCIVVINLPVPVAKASPSLLLARDLPLDASNHVRLPTDCRFPLVRSCSHVVVAESLSPAMNMLPQPHPTLHLPARVDHHQPIFYSPLLSSPSLKSPVSGTPLPGVITDLLAEVCCVPRPRRIILLALTKVEVKIYICYLPLRRPLEIWSSPTLIYFK